MEKKPDLYLRSGYRAEIRVERTGISFHDLPGGKVRIQVKVQNVGDECSSPTPMLVQSAPLGAFVPWKPLAHLTVPRLDPGESCELSTEAERPQPSPLGDFDRVPPKTLLTAVSSPGQSTPRPRRSFSVVTSLLRARTTPPTELKEGEPLANDIWDLLGRGQPHWAGNINVFVGARAVERHMAMALRVFPGRTNVAMFVVGGVGKRDAYAFELKGLDFEWKAALYDVTKNKSLLAQPSDLPIKEMQWVEADGGLLATLAVHPPVSCQTGNLEVHVTRRSCGKTAIVEFNLDPDAKGPGCYFV